MRQVLYETSQRVFARCACAQRTGFLIKFFNQESVLHLRFGTEKNRRLGSKKARYIRAFRRRHLFCLHIMATVYKNDTVSNGFIWFHTKMKLWRMEVKPYLSVRKTGC